MQFAAWACTALPSALNDEDGLSDRRACPRKNTVASFRPMDCGFLILSVLLTTWSAIWFSVVDSGGSKGSLYAQIQSATGISMYPLSVDRDIKVDGPEGVTWLRVEKGAIFAVDSPGPRRIIMLMGKVREKGQWLASLPNRVFVRVVSASGDSSRSDLDAEAY